VASVPGSAYKTEEYWEQAKTKEDLSRFHTQCQEAKSSLENFRRTLLNVEANQAEKELLRPILTQLEGMHERLSKLTDEEIRELTCNGFAGTIEEVYSIIIGLAQDPVMHTHLLGQQLTVQKQKILSRLKILSP